MMNPDLILPKSAQNYNESINHKFEFTKPINYNTDKTVLQQHIMIKLF